MSLLMDALTWLFAGGHWTGSTGILMRIVQHLGVTVGVVAIAGLIALPIGIYIGHTGRFVTLISATFGVARAIPTLGVLTLMNLRHELMPAASADSRTEAGRDVNAFAT